MFKYFIFTLNKIFFEGSGKSVYLYPLIVSRWEICYTKFANKCVILVLMGQKTSTGMEAIGWMKIH